MRDEGSHTRMPDKKSIEHIKLYTSPKIAGALKGTACSSAQSKTKIPVHCISDVGQLTGKEFSLKAGKCL